jgi:hypothetical protein
LEALQKGVMVGGHHLAKLFSVAKNGAETNREHRDPFH